VQEDARLSMPPGRPSSKSSKSSGSTVRAKTWPLHSDEILEQFMSHDYFD
jgi:hypothetical protein